jgi:hypothetical protein
MNSLRRIFSKATRGRRERRERRERVLERPQEGEEDMGQQAVIVLHILPQDM